MLKGINRQVLEIHDTGTQYFEKALLFVKPEYVNLGEESLREKFLNAFSGSTVPVSRKSRARSLFTAVTLMLASAGIGALITALIR